VTVRSKPVGFETRALGGAPPIARPSRSKETGIAAGRRVAIWVLPKVAFRWGKRVSSPACRGPGALSISPHFIGRHAAFTSTRSGQAQTAVAIVRGRRRTDSGRRSRRGVSSMRGRRAATPHATSTGCCPAPGPLHATTSESLIFTPSRCARTATAPLEPANTWRPTAWRGHCSGSQGVHRVSMLARVSATGPGAALRRPRARWGPPGKGRAARSPQGPCPRAHGWPGE